MRYQRITARGEPINLGYKNEDDATEIAFDIPDDWQDGIVTLYVLRMGDSDSYVPSGFRVEDGVAYWLVSSVDTACEGRGLATYCSVVNGKVMKSRTFTTIVKASSVDLNRDVPEPQKSVLEASLDIASTLAARAEQSANKAQETAETMAQDAESILADAQGYVEDAESFAGQAEQSAERAASAVYEWFTLSVNEQTGQLVVTERNRS